MNKDIEAIRACLAAPDTYTREQAIEDARWLLQYVDHLQEQITAYALKMNAEKPAETP